MDSVRRTSSGPSGGAPRQYYVAVGSADVKLATLVDLLLAVQAGGPVALAVHCGARDSLDEVAAGLAALESTSVTCLHADLSDSERVTALADFVKRARPAPPDATESTSAEATSAAGSGAAGGNGAHVLVVSDVGLRALEGRGMPPPPPLLLHYDLPARKDVYTRRAAVANRARGWAGRPAIVVYFVVAGQVADFRAVEEHAGGGGTAIAEMPVHVAELFGGQ